MFNRGERHAGAIVRAYQPEFQWDRHRLIETHPPSLGLKPTDLNAAFVVLGYVAKSLEFCMSRSGHETRL